VCVSTVRRWVLRFSSGDSDVRDGPRSEPPCTAASSRNEKRFNQFIRAKGRIMTRELSTELNVGFSALEMMLATFVPCESHGYQFEDHEARCNIWSDCPTTPILKFRFGA
jgi:hypothetical protein